MAQITGRVFRVFSKEWPSKRPGGKPNTTYSVKLEDDPIYYRTPRGSKPGSDGERFAGIAEPGAMVTFEAEPINDTSAQINGAVTKVEEKASPTGTASPAGAAVQGYNGGGSRDASIQYQSSRKDALEFVSLAVKAAAIKLPAKEAAKLETLEALVDHYTAAYFADIDTKGAVARAAGVDGDEPGAEAAKPAGDEE